MKPAQQFRALQNIIGQKHKGYIFLPTIEKSVARTTKRKTGWTEGPAFAWPPKDKGAKIIAHLGKHKDDDLYFTPGVFSSKTRATEHIVTDTKLWADLDEVDPQELPDDLKPTHAWRTSSGRYAGVWDVTEALESPYAPGGINHRLTKYLGADPSGWDTTQLLRVPGSANNKPGKAEGERGELLWTRQGMYEPEDFDSLPDIKGVDAKAADLSDADLDEVDRVAVWKRVRERVNKQVREYMRMTDDGGLDRSDILWQIERELADAGCSLAEIVAIVRPTPWNKYEGRRDELERLVNEGVKALAAVDDTSAPLEAGEDEEMPLPTLPPTLYEVTVPRPPRELIRDFMQEGALGFIAGIPKSMKSWFAIDLGLSMASGMDFLDYRVVKPQNVLYIQEEDDIATVMHRVGVILDSKAPHHHYHGQVTFDPATRTIEHHAAVPMKREFRPIVGIGFDGSKKKWLDWVERMIVQAKAGVLILDALMKMSGALDADKPEIRKEFLDPLQDIARRHKCAVIIVHHNTKGQGNERAAQNMSGSGQIHAWANWGMYIQERIGNSVRFELERKSGASKTLAYAIDGLIETDIEDIETDGGTREAWFPRGITLHNGRLPRPTHRAEPQDDRGQRDPKTGEKREPKRNEVNEKRAAEALKLRQKIREIKEADPKRSNRSIATHLGVSPGTVTDHLKKIREEDARAQEEEDQVALLDEDE